MLFRYSDFGSHSSFISFDHFRGILSVEFFSDKFVAICWKLV
jgi:hypothetical protein